MQNNIDTIISNALVVNKDILRNNIKDIIKQVETAILNNKDTIEAANKVDEKNSNGFMIDFNVINNIFANINTEDLFFGTVTLSEKDDKNKIIYGKEILDCGNTIIINDGNPYVIIEMALRNIMAGNTTIFVNDGYMFGTNQLIVQLIQSVFEQYNLSKYLIQIYVTEEYDDVLNNFANIDLVICIGDHNLQNLILSKSKNKTIVSGYENFDLYIEDTFHLEFLSKIANSGLNIQLYIKDDANLDYDNAIIVNDIDEAISQINYNGSRYSTAIFTSSSDNASKFIKEVKSKMVVVNTSPTIERIIDIKQEDLTIEKTIIYPLSFNIKKEDE